MFYSKEKQKHHVSKLIFTFKWSQNAGRLFGGQSACYWFLFVLFCGEGEVFVLSPKILKLLILKKSVISH